MPYPGDPLPLARQIKDVTPISIPDVEKAFDSIPIRGEYILCKSSPELISTGAYDPYETENLELFKKDSGRKRHFQGLVRTSDGKHLIFSGGELQGQKASQLFICSVASHQSEANRLNPKGVIGSNMNHRRTNDRLVGIYAINREKLWHCGGLSILGHILVAPIEGDDGSKAQVRFIDVSHPRAPKDLGDGVAITRHSTKAGAASLIRLPNLHYLCAVWTDGEEDQKRRLDFYLSKTELLADGFDLTGMKTITYGATGKAGTHPKYQVIQLVLQDDGKIFLIGTENSYGWAPIPPWVGKNRARLYKICFTGQDLTKSDFKLNIPTISIIRDTNAKIFGPGSRRYNFNAGAGVYLTPDQQLAIYACHHRKSAQSMALQCTEFYPHPNKKIITDLAEGIIELYDDKNFNDRCLKIRGNYLAKIEDYKKVDVEGEHFNDKVSSIRFQLPKDKVYEFCEHREFKGKRATITGTGHMEEISDLDKKTISSFCKIPGGFSDKTSSSRFLHSQ